MMYIPNEIIMEILSRLPVRSILKFRCVCKKWCEFLNHHDTKFVNMHLSNSIKKNNFTLLFTIYEEGGVYSMDYDSSLGLLEVVQVDSPFRDECEPVEIFGYCNGLFFIRITQDRIIGMWNPATKEYKILPVSTTTQIGYSNDLWYRKYCFGYDHKSNEYKLVTILTPFSDDNSKSQVEIYTVSSNLWRSIACIPYRIMGGPPGVFVNGASHWLADTCPIRSNKVLLSFNMAGEVFSELPLLEIFLDDNCKFEHKCLDVLEGLLCMLCSHSRVGFEVWVMTKYGVRDSWTKRYSISKLKIDTTIPSFRFLRRLHSLKNEEMLLEIRLDTWKHSALVVYDPKREWATVLKIDLRKYGRWWDENTGHLTTCFHTQTYVESLVSLHSGTYTGGGQELSDLNKALEIVFPSDEE